MLKQAIANVLIESGLIAAPDVRNAADDLADKLAVLFVPIVDAEQEDLARDLDSEPPLVAVHRGGGSYSIMRGDLEIIEKLTKKQAAEFNALDDAGKAKVVAEDQEP